MVHGLLPLLSGMLMVGIKRRKSDIFRLFSFVFEIFSLVYTNCQYIYKRALNFNFVVIILTKETSLSNKKKL